MRLVKILGGSCCGLMLMLLCNACADNSDIIELNDNEYTILSLNSADLNSDGEISKKEASSIKSLYINDEMTDGDVDSLSLLRYCTSLETLIISIDGSLLQSLDLSNNKQLKRLYCWDLDLEHLDISQNENLEFLCLFHNGGLSELDLSNNRELRELYVMGLDADISELDLSNNPELRKLSCWCPNISKLDLSNNKLLEYIDVPSEVEIIR